MNHNYHLRLRYFPVPGRAGAIRDALNMGGIPFVDDHITPEQFGEKRAAGEFPFGGIPVLDIETASGKLCSAQSNAILRFAGRLTGLYPINDPLLALKVDEALDFGEDINQLLGPSFREQDMEKKLAMRKVLAEKNLPEMASYLERLLIANGNTGFVVGKSLTIADLKLYGVVSFLTSGHLDGIPSALLDKYPAIQSWKKNIGAVREERLAKAKG